MMMVLGTTSSFATTHLICVIVYLTANGSIFPAFNLKWNLPFAMYYSAYYIYYLKNSSNITFVSFLAHGIYLSLNSLTRQNLKVHHHR